MAKDGKSPNPDLQTYNEDEADEIAKGIYADYAPLLRELRDLLIIRKNETENKDLF